MNARHTILKIITMLSIATLFTHIHAVDKQTDIQQTIKTISKAPESIKAADINQISSHISQTWDKTTDPIAQEMAKAIQDPNIMNRIIHVVVDESWQVEDTTIYFLLNTYPQIVNPLIQYATTSLDQVKTMLIEALVYQNHQAILQFIKASFANPDTPITAMNFLFELAKRYNVTIPAEYSAEQIKKRLKDFFAKRTVKTNVAMLTMIVCYKHMFGSFPCTINTITPTIQHVLANADMLACSQTFSTYTINQLYSSLVENIIIKEQELDNQGYFTFIHGQRWQFRIIEQWFTKLWEIRNQRTLNDFLFIHCEKLSQTKAELEKESKLRKHILKCGGQDHREKLLFLNYAFFGNENCSSSCSAQYLLKNHSVIDLKISLKDVFTMIDYQAYYDKYHKELEELEDEHKSLSSTGHLLLIGVPKTMLTDCIYISGSGGILQYPSVNGQSTNDITLIMDTLRNHPEKMSSTDIIQFCLILTHDILTPDNGIKVYSYSLVDPAQLAAFEKKSEALFMHIKNDIAHDQLNAAAA